MPLTVRPRSPLSSTPSASTLRTVPAVFVVGWLLLAAAEVFAPMGGPAIPLGVAVVSGLLMGTEIGFWSGLTVGLAADLLSALPLGTQAFTAGLAGLGVGSLSTTLSQSSWTGPALFVLLVSAPYRWVVGLVSELGGHPGSQASTSFTLIAWDVALAVFLYLGLSRWHSGRR